MKIMFVGDINLGEYYPSFGNGPGTFAKDRSVFSGVESQFNRADIVVGNLEASITSEDWENSSPEKQVLKVDPKVAYHLKEAGFGIMQVANNHTVQHGERAFMESADILKGMGISAVGLNNQEPVVIHGRDTSVGFLAASDVPDNTDKEQTLYQRMDENFLSIIDKHVNTVDHLVVMLHWGLEASTTPMDYQREYAEKLRAKGVRAIIGTHPHLFYEIESDHRFVCAYSLGDFVFDLCWDKRLTRSGILELDFSGNEISGKVWPVELTCNGCLPVISGDPVPLQGSIVLYDHGSKLRFQRLRKSWYLFFNFFKGNTILKLKFVKSKALKVARITNP